MGCVQDVSGKKKFLVQYKDGKNKEMGPCSNIYVCSKYEVCLDMDEPISNLTKKNKANCGILMGILMLKGLACFK